MVLLKVQNKTPEFFTSLKLVAPSTIILKNIFQKIAKAGNYKIKVTFANKSSTFLQGTKTREKNSGKAANEAVLSASPDLSITFHTVWAQWRTIIFFPVGFLDGYIDGSVDLEGENPIYKLAQLGRGAGIDKIREGLFKPIFFQNPLVWFTNFWYERTQDNTDREQTIKNVRFHYSLPVELFKYKLGETIGYSEGYWPEGTKNLNQAKHNNYEYICQKLRLEPGMKVLEVGSGWGFLPIYMVKNYDVDVVVYNPTKEQNEYMKKRFERHGVAGRIRLVFGDHRDIVKEGKIFDRFVSIGVHEHHGMRKKMYRMWWNSISRVLKERGIGVISTSSFMDYCTGGYLSLRYIWPGGHIPSVPLEISTLHKEGLELVELENLWPHYWRTMKMWGERFKKYWPQIHASNPGVFDERFRRRWTMYLEAFPDSFERRLDCSHFIFVKGRYPDAYPKTLEARYRKPNFRTGKDTVECYE